MRLEKYLPFAYIALEVKFVYNFSSKGTAGIGLKGTFWGW